MTVKYKKILRIAILTALSLLTVYLLYGTIGSIVVWYQQPLFTAADGETSRSLGFFILFAVFGILALLSCGGTALCVWLFFFRRKKTPLFVTQATEQAFETAALTVDPEREPNLSPQESHADTRSEGHSSTDCPIRSSPSQSNLSDENDDDASNANLLKAK